MAKVLRCGEVFSGCDTVIYGKDEDEVVAKEEEHVRKDHNMTMIPMDTIKDMASHVRDGDPPRRRWFGLGGR
jgi:predicted small metal-binding protein